jgi:hypothetical protein
MHQESSEKDPFTSLEKMLAKACDQSAAKVIDWQKVHQADNDGYQLVRQFNEDRQKLSETGSFRSAYTIFANASGVSICNLAVHLDENPDDPKLAAGTSTVLLSSLQTNIASFVSSDDFGLEKPFMQTLTTLKVQQVPLETHLSALSRRIDKFCPHCVEMIRAVERDLVNQINPLTFSNAAKNIREAFGQLIHKLAPDEQVCHWPDVERDPKTRRPIRRSRLEFHAFLGRRKGEWPQTWIDQVAEQIESVLDALDDLDKLTHIRESTADELQTARISLDRFVNELIQYLDMADATNKIPPRAP